MENSAEFVLPCWRPCAPPSSESGSAPLLPRGLHAASRHQAAELWPVGAPVLQLHLFCAALSKVCPKESENLRRLFFSVWECSEIFSYKLKVTASALIKSFIGMLSFQLLGKHATPGVTRPRLCHMSLLAASNRFDLPWKGMGGDYVRPWPSGGHLSVCLPVTF